MPYFFNNEVNILVIHIPKTGGQSLEQYFSRKYSISIGKNSLHGLYKDFKENKLNFIYLQHLRFNQILSYHNDLGIRLKDLVTISIVRNPYKRAISALFYNRFLKDEEATPSEVVSALQYALSKKEWYNQFAPQYSFLLNGDYVDSSIRVLRTETLCDDMKRLGFNDFNVFNNKNHLSITDYERYINDDFIKLINTLYEKDFVLFNYEMRGLKN